jgi:hypothetical protein
MNLEKNVRPGLGSGWVGLGVIADNLINVGRTLRTRS